MGRYVALEGLSPVDYANFGEFADTNNIIILYPQAIADSTSHNIWDGGVLPNPNGCWDWVGWYGANADQIGGTMID